MVMTQSTSLSPAFCLCYSPSISLPCLPSAWHTAVSLNEEESAEEEATRLTEKKCSRVSQILHKFTVAKSLNSK